MLNRILAFITADPLRKIFAIFFAFGLWIYVAIGNNYTYQREITVSYVDLPDSLMIVDSVPRVRVAFTGRGGALFTIWAAPPKALCDLNEATPGTMKIDARDLRTTAGYGPLRVEYETPTLSVAIDRRDEKEVAVTVPIKGAPRPGFTIDTISTTGPIRVTGPRQLLEALLEVPTETVSIRNRAETFEREVKLVLASPFIKPSRASVAATVRMGEATNHVLADIPLVIIRSTDQQARSDRFRLDTLVLEGSRRRLTGLGARDVAVRIDVTGLAAGSYDLAPDILLPPYITALRTVPERFTITID